MSAPRVLFMSGSIGLGHVTHDVAIVGELRKLVPDVQVSWLAASPASRVIQEADEHLLPDSADLVEENAMVEGVAKGVSLSLIRYAFRARSQWPRNVEVFRRVTSRERFDVVVGDETYEVIQATNGIRI